MSLTPRIIIADAIAGMRSIRKPGSVRMIITSPPYFGLRDYGMKGQIGLEPTPDEYVARLVAVFREARRLLDPAGTLWLNLGDSYITNNRNGFQGKNATRHGALMPASLPTNRKRAPGLADKSLIGIPWRVALALQADGWILRQEIIWEKPNALPESVRDRFTRSHEHLFMFALQRRYYFDQAAIKEPSVDRRHDKPPRTKGSFDGKTGASSFRAPRLMRNRRSVWRISSAQYKGAHFAVFPEALVEPCILAGSPRGGVVLDPFAGSGTTLAVAARLGRRAIGIELNPDYEPLMRERISR